jgi:hypothetical protein
MRALAVVVLLAGCATPKPMIWDKPGGTQAGFDTDTAVCQFEVAKSTQGTDPAMRTIFGQELDRAMRQRDLYGLCMRSKGYTLRQ